MFGGYYVIIVVGLLLMVGVVWFINFVYGDIVVLGVLFIIILV